jgi:halogenation protein CepH
MNSGGVEKVDVVVAGGGPGGSTLASLVAMQGHRVVILEKEKFPRYQIGESLLPSTTRGICGLTGVANDLAQAGFTRKRGGTFRWGSNPEPWTFAFSVSPNVTANSSYAYQVERSKFDKILLDHARRLGVDVRERCAVTDVLSDGDRVRGVSYLDGNGRNAQIRAQYVVDASGHRSSIYRHAGGSRKYSEFFRSLALFGYFHGGKRLPPPNSGNILCAAFNSGWFWYIPLSETLTSVGAVVGQEYVSKMQGDPENALRALIAECPLISDYLTGAERITDGDYGRLRVRKDYSYHNTSFWRRGMILIGDAACFVDPVISSGVHLATYSALLGARSINSVMAGLVDERTAFREFERRYRREYGVFYEFLMSFYNMQASESSYFWSAKKITKNTHSELESFVDLAAGISSGEAVFAGPEPPVLGLRSRADEVISALDEYVANNERSMLPWFKSSIVREATFEMAQVQTLAVLGENREIEPPLFDDGLVPSADGMFWARPQ